MVTPRQKGWRPASVKVSTALAALLMFLPAACGGESLSEKPAIDSMAAENPSEADSEIGAAPRHLGPMGFGKYLAGRMAQNESDTAAAADYYLAALDADPTNVDLARRAYFYLLAEGRIAPAMDLAERVMALDPSSTVAPLVLAVGDCSKNDYQAAADRLAAVSTRGLNSFVVPMMQAWAQAGLQQWDAALAALEPMHADPKLNQLYNFHAGLIMDLAGRNEQAWTHYQATLNGSEALSLRTVEVVASFLDRQGKTADALELIDRYRTQHPNSVLVDAVFSGKGKIALPQPVTSANEGMAEALYGAASSIIQTNSLDTSMAFARLAVVLRPDFPFAEMMIGDILNNQERFADAVDIYGKVKVDNPIYFSTRLRMATALERMEKLDKATKVLTDLAKAFPDQAEPLITYGDLLRRQKKWDAAAKVYRQALTLFPTDEPRLWGLYYSLGISLERGKHWPDAEKALKKALELEPDQPQVLNYLGYSWIDRGINIEQGKEMIEKAVLQLPTDGYITDSLGWAYFLTGDFERAVVELERAIEFTPADPTINEHLGDAYWRVGRRAEAEFQWRRALTLEPEPEQIDGLKHKITHGMDSPAAKGAEKNQ